MRAPKTKASNPTDLPLPEVSEKVVAVVAAKADSQIVPHTIDYNQYEADAPRNFVSTTLPFNQYEDALLKQAVEKSEHKTVKGFIRAAYMAEARRVVEGKIS